MRRDPTATWVTFSNFLIRPGLVEWECTEKRTGQGVRRLHNSIRFDSFVPSHDIIASSLATFCGSAYATIYFGLTLHEDAITSIAEFTGASVSAKRVLAGSGVRVHRSTPALCFSGGFDSLAAYCLMPSGTQLISLDFGGWFAREARFFERFDTHIVRTDARRGNALDGGDHLDLDGNSWTFMGFGAMLYRDHLGLDTILFGTILESYRHSVDKGRKCQDDPFPFPGFGLTRKVYVGGLTEVATAFVCEYFAEDYVSDSLVSLAGVGSTKLYRKELLIHLAKLKYGRTTTMASLHIPTHPLVFGDYGVDDLLIFYIRKKLGAEVADKLCCNMSPDAIELCDTLHLDFYERVMPELVNLCDLSEEKGYFSKLAEAGILPWDDNDWEEFRQVMDVLRVYHPEVAVIHTDT